MAKRNNLSDPMFQDADKAREWLEARLWKDGPICPHCGVIDDATQMKGKSHRPGLYQCNACREPFTVTVGTLYERSKLPLHKWLAATFLLMSSKKGMSAVQIGRMLGISQKSSWFMCHRIRESLKPKRVAPFGSGGGVVEVDETYQGSVDEPMTMRTSGKPFLKRKPKMRSKRAVVALVDRGGKVMSFHVPRANAETVTEIMRAHISPDAQIHTDEARIYTKVGTEFAAHETVTHSAGEYARGSVNTNTVESVFSVFKRGMIGTYHHCGEQHLHRYLAEFDYRFSTREAVGMNDMERMTASFDGIVGRRLTYRETR